MNLSTVDKIIADIENEKKQFDGLDDDVSREHVAGLDRALDIIRGHTDRLR